MKADTGAAALWAEREMALPKRSRTALRGADAAAFGRDLVARAAGGRPALAEHERLGVTMQVRLTSAEKDELKAVAARLGRKPSEIAREALHDYVVSHRAD